MRANGGRCSSVQAELMRLADGDAISVQGAFKAELYDKDGEKRLSLSIVAERVLGLGRRKDETLDDALTF
jgi:single-stranded DNA-binding protein